MIQDRQSMVVRMDEALDCTEEKPDQEAGTYVGRLGHWDRTEKRGRTLCN